jgi:chaperonin GroES
MNYKTLLEDRILVDVSSEEKTASGFIINKDPKEMDRAAYKTGTVVSVGEGRMLDNGTIIPMKVKKDDKIIFQFGDVIDIGEKTFFLIRGVDAAIILED